jgi:hypothetical protein
MPTSDQEVFSFALSDHYEWVEHAYRPNALGQFRNYRFVDRAPLASNYLPNRDRYGFVVLRHGHRGNVVRLISHVLFLLCRVGFVGGPWRERPRPLAHHPSSRISSRWHTYLAKTGQLRAQGRAREMGAQRGGSAGDLCRRQPCVRAPASSCGETMRDDLEPLTHNPGEILCCCGVHLF